MRKNIRVGVVCLTRKTYDYKAAAEIYAQTLERLKKMPDTDWVVIPEAVIEVADAQKAADIFARSALDGVVIITGTFHLGHLALVIKKRVDIPTLLWAFSELPYDGGKIRLNSVCGLNLNASNLYKAGYDDVSCTVGDDIDTDWVDALRMKAAVVQSHIGIVGYRADGFFNLDIDEMDTYRRTGILIDHYEISELASTPADEKETAEYAAGISGKFNCCGISDAQLGKVAALCVRFKKFMAKYSLTALAVRCWPEFANTYGISPCAAMSILQSEGYLLGCEGDLEGTMSMIACDAIGGQTPFLADLSQVDFDNNYALLWHCGVAPMNLWDGRCDRSLDTYFAGGRGVTTGFVLREGRINVMRIDSARGQTRMFLEGGKAVPMAKQLTGTYAKVVFDRNIRDVLDTVTSTGVAHHISMIYGEHMRALRIFAKMMGYSVIE
jgi:L-fucose isomerase-like protein